MKEETDMSLKETVISNRDREVLQRIEDLESQLLEEGWEVQYGNIGKRTTFAYLHRKDSDAEIVGHTFIKDLRYSNKNIGRLKSLNQALARKELIENKENPNE